MIFVVSRAVKAHVMMGGSIFKSKQDWLIFGLFLAVLLISMAIYWPGLNGFLLLDDFPQLKPIINGVDSANWHHSAKDFILSESGLLGRPVAMASFIFNAVTSGDDIWYWKYTNLMLHLLTGAALILLTGRLLDASGSSMQHRNKWFFALAVGALWLLHPLQVSTVLYTVQRMTQLSSLFVILGLLAYTVGRQAQLAARLRRAYLLLLLAFGVCFPLALLSKENGALFPLFAFLVELLFFRFQGGNKDKNIVRLIFIFSLAIPLIIFVYVLLSNPQVVLKGYETRAFTLTERVFTELRVVSFYLYQLVLPIQRNMVFFYDNFPISKGIFSPLSTLISLFLVVGALVLAFVLRHRNVLFSFGIVFYFAAHSLESTILPLELMFEHRNYLASYGIFMGMAGFLNMHVDRKKLLAGLSVIAVALYLVVTSTRVLTWSDPNKFYPNMFEANPNSPRLAIIFANSYSESGKYDQAKGYIKNFQGPGFVLQRLQITCLQNHGLSNIEMDQALAQFEGVITTYEVEGLIQLSNLGLDKKCIFSSEKFVKILDKSLTMKIVDAKSEQKIWLYKAHYLYQDKKIDAALAALERSYSARTDNPIPLFLAAEWMLTAGDLDKARNFFSRGKKVAVKSSRDYSEFTTSIEKRLNIAYANQDRKRH